MAADAGGSQDDHAKKKKKRKQKKSERQKPPPDLTKPGTPISSRYYPSRTPPEPVPISDTDLAVIIRRLRTSQYQDIKTFSPELEAFETQQPSTSAPRSVSVEPRQSIKIESRTEDINAMLPSEQITETSMGRVISADSKPIFNSNSDSVDPAVLSRSNDTSSSNITGSLEPRQSIKIESRSEDINAMVPSEQITETSRGRLISADSKPIFNSNSDFVDPAVLSRSNDTSSSNITGLTDDSGDFFLIHDSDGEVLMAVDDNFDSSFDTFHSSSDHGMNYDSTNNVISSSSSNEIPAKSISAEVLKKNQYVSSAEENLTLDDLLNDQASRVLFQSTSPPNPSEVLLSDVDFYKDNAKSESEESILTQSSSFVLAESGTIVNMDDIEPEKPNALRLSNINIAKIDEQHRNSIDRKPRASTNDSGTSVRKDDTIDDPNKDVYFVMIDQVSPDTLRAFNRNLMKKLADEENNKKSSIKNFQISIPFPTIKAKPQKILPENVMKSLHDRESSIPRSTGYENVNQIHRERSYYKDLSKLPQASNKIKSEVVLENSGFDAKDVIKASSHYEDLLKSEPVSKRETTPNAFANDKLTVFEPTSTDLTIPGTPINSKMLKTDPATGRNYYDIKPEPTLPTDEHASSSHDGTKEHAPVNSENLIDETGEYYYADEPKLEVPLQVPEQPNEITERTIHLLALTPGTPVSSKNLKKDNETGLYYYDLRATPGRPLPEPPRPIKMTDRNDNDSHLQMKSQQKPDLDLLRTRFSLQIGSSGGIFASEKSVMSDIPNVVESSSDNQLVQKDITEESAINEQKQKPGVRQQDIQPIYPLKSSRVKDEAAYKQHFNQQQCLQVFGMQTIHFGKELRFLNSSFHSSDVPGQPIPQNLVENELQLEERKNINEFPEIMKPRTQVSSKNFQQDSKVSPADSSDEIEEIKIPLINVPGTPVTSKNLRKDNVTGEYYYASKKQRTTAIPVVAPPFQSALIKSPIVPNISDGSEGMDNPVERMMSTVSESSTDTEGTPITPVSSNVLQFEDIGTSRMTPNTKSAVNVADVVLEPITSPATKSFADIGLNPMSTVTSRIVHFKDTGTGPMTPTINKSEMKMTDAGLDPILMNRPKKLTDTESVCESTQTSKRYPGYNLSAHMKWYARRYTAALEEMYQDLSESLGVAWKSNGMSKSATTPSKLDRQEAHSSSSSYSLNSSFSARKFNALRAGPDKSRDRPGKTEADEQKQEDDTSSASESDA